jgi:DNA-binding NtrC family response regulator
MRDILVVEDNGGLREVLKEALTTADITVEAVESAEEAFEKLGGARYDMVITDLKLPEADGIAVLEAVKKAYPDTEVVVVTAHGTVDRAVEAMKKGASDFITKPFSIAQIRMQAGRILGTKNLREENAYLRSMMERRIIGSGQKITAVLEIASRAAEKDATVLLTGASGTGKELIAEEIHRRSKRNAFPLVKVNCAALAPGLLESELFGHEKGAFTDAYTMKKGRFELADRGTIFLDEIAELPLALQVKILRVIQEREFERVGGEKTLKTDVRIIAATNRDLKAMAGDGTFRQELYYRLNVVEIKMPALKDRKEDIPGLVEYFIKKYAEYGNFRVKGITKDALDALVSYDYPGNVRELENIVQRAMVMCRGEMINPEDIPYELINAGAPENALDSLDAKVGDFEKELIRKALAETGGNRAKAAELLKANRVTLLAKIKKYGLSLKEEK